MTIKITYKVELRLTKEARKHLLGKTIVNVQYNNYSDEDEPKGIIFQLDDGKWWAVMQDEEGNGPGTLHREDKPTDTEWVIIPTI